MHYPNGGFSIDRRNMPAVCPKCDEDLICAKARKPLVVDLAHRAETVSQALAKLDAAVSECLWHGHPSLKVIHDFVEESARHRGMEQKVFIEVSHCGFITNRTGTGSKRKVSRTVISGGVSNDSR